MKPAIICPTSLMACFYDYFLFPRWEAQTKMTHPYIYVIQSSEPFQLKPLACLVLDIHMILLLAALVRCMLCLITS